MFRFVGADPCVCPIFATDVPISAMDVPAFATDVSIFPTDVTVCGRTHGSAPTCGGAILFGRHWLQTGHADRVKEDFLTICHF